MTLIHPDPFALDPAAVRLWQTNPVEAFRRWIVSERDNPLTRRLTERSLGQYCSMLGMHGTWVAEERHRELHIATPPDIAAFLGSLKDHADANAATATTRWRYVRLLDVFYERMRLAGARTDNPMTPLLPLAENLAPERTPPEFLAEHQVARFLAWCAAEWAQEGAAAAAWRYHRDLAIRVTLLATGISVSELRRLTLADLAVAAPSSSAPPTNEGPWTDCGTDAVVQVHRHTAPATGDQLVLRIEASGKTEERSLTIPPWAAGVLLNWHEQALAWRGRLATESGPAPLFPSRDVRQHVDRPAFGRAIAPDDIFRVVQRAFKGAVLATSQQGPQTLRNTFLARHLAAGAAEADLLHWAGLRTPASLERLRPHVPIASTLALAAEPA